MRNNTQKNVPCNRKRLQVNKKRRRKKSTYPAGYDTSNQRESLWTTKMSGCEMSYNKEKKSYDVLKQQQKQQQMILM
jgi:hypothetical protein